MSPKLFNSLLIIVSVVLYFYVIDPLYTGADAVFWNSGPSIQSLNVLKNQYQATIDGVSGILQEAKDLEKEYNSFDATTTKNMMIMVPSSIEEVRLLSELTEMANLSGFSIEGLNVKDKSGEYTVNFTMNTTYPKFKTFMYKFETSMRLFTLKSVSFTPSKDETELIKFSVELSTYYMK